jgi:hypothetical protein
MARQGAKDGAVVTMQIIAGAMIAGVAVFGIIAAAQGLSQPPDPEQMPLVSYFGAALTFFLIAAAAIAPSMIARASRQKPMSGRSDARAAKQSEERDLPSYGTYQTMLIVRLALLEGAAFVNLVAVLNEHQWWSLALAGLLLLIMVVCFPTRGRIEAFVRQQRELAELEASRGGH